MWQGALLPSPPTPWAKESNVTAQHHTTQRWGPAHEVKASVLLESGEYLHGEACDWGDLWLKIKLPNLSRVEIVYMLYRLDYWWAKISFLSHSLCVSYVSPPNWHWTWVCDLFDAWVVRYNVSRVLKYVCVIVCLLSALRKCALVSHSSKDVGKLLWSPLPVFCIFNLLLVWRLIWKRGELVLSCVLTPTSCVISPSHVSGS